MTYSALSFNLNTELDRSTLARKFANQGRIQIHDVLRPETAESIRSILQNETKWGLAWQAATEGPHALRHQQTKALTNHEMKDILDKSGAAVGAGKYGFIYRQYAMLDAYLGKWDPGHPLDQLLEHLNSQPFLKLIRDVTGVHSIVKAEAQATCFDPGHFLTEHDDSHPRDPRRIAYVLNLCIPDWKSEWGGYLNFFDEHGNIDAGFKPAFNTLNMFTVPQRHSVSYVPEFAPVGRFAITGWAMDP